MAPQKLRARALAGEGAVDRAQASYMDRGPTFLNARAARHDPVPNSQLRDSYLSAHAYDHDRVEHDTRTELLSLPVQRRDLAIVRDVWRYKLLATGQLQELWWPQATQRAAQKRLTRLFEAGLLERFRPVTRRGSYPWIYQLGSDGHRLLQGAGLIPPRRRFERRDVYDYTYVLHDLHVNSWVLAYRRQLGEALVEWHGESAIEPPPPARNSQLMLGDNWSAEDLKLPQGRTLVPDAALEITGTETQATHQFLIEYDRTSRVDKNYEKFRRYDAFLVHWWRQSALGDREQPPFVLFVCQNEAQRDSFLAAADRELTGHHWNPSVRYTADHYVGRRRILFACEADSHAGLCEARRVPPYPPSHPARVGQDAVARLVRLPEAPRTEWAEGASKPTTREADSAAPQQTLWAT